jgi:hypothetical protein
MLVESSTVYQAVLGWRRRLEPSCRSELNRRTRFRGMVEAPRQRLLADKAYDTDRIPWYRWWHSRNCAA